MSSRRLLAALAAVLTGTAASVALLGAPAEAAACSRGTGVTVVVDYHQLGGGVTTTCVPNGGGQYAAAVFRSAGVSMQYAQGFVCRVNGKPVDQACTDAPPVDAYWSLWQSSGGNGTWAYAQRGVSSLKVATGDWVAWSWNGSKGQVQPGVTPLGPAPAPRPTATAAGGTAGGSTGGRATPGSGSAATPSVSPRPSASVSPTATPLTEKQQKEEAEAQASARATAESGASEDTETTSARSDDDGAGSGYGVPWFAVAVLVLLGASGGVVAWRRRTAGER